MNEHPCELNNEIRMDVYSRCIQGEAQTNTRRASWNQITSFFCKRRERSVGQASSLFLPSSPLVCFHVCKDKKKRERESELVLQKGTDTEWASEGDGMTGFRFECAVETRLCQDYPSPPLALSHIDNCFLFCFLFNHHGTYTSTTWQSAQ
jgi:hypothetical protein